MPAPKLLALTLILGLLSGDLRGAERRAAPAPTDLLAMAFSQPAAPYSGRVTLTQWEGAVRRSEEANVYFRPPQTYRFEFLTPEGSVDRVVLSDGARREVQVRGDRAGAQPADAATAVPLADQRRLLLANYRPTLTGRETVLSREAWVLELTPSVDGKPHQRMLVDRESHVVLEVRRSMADAGATTQFTRFEPNAVLKDDLFAWKSPELAEKESESRTTAERGVWPDALPGGFTLVTSDAFVISGRPIRQFVYSDGLSLLSLFVTSAPVAAPSAAGRPDADLDLRLPDSIRQWRHEGDYVTAIGALPPSLFVEIQQKIR